MNITFRTLKPDEIETRCQQVTEKGYILLLYKDARADMKILDETVGPMNWRREHTRENANCIVSIWDEEKKQWVSKEDTGVESNTEKEKGQASDSFKRACVNWGIGRELYSSPFIWITSKADEITLYNGKWKLKSGVDFKVSSISYDEDRNITALLITDNKNTVRYTLVVTPQNTPNAPKTDLKSKGKTNTPTKVKNATEGQIMSINTLVTLVKGEHQQMYDFYKVKSYAELEEDKANQIIEQLKKKCEKLGIVYSEV